MSRRRAKKEPEVRWMVTDQALGGLTVERVITLHHFLALTSDRELLTTPLEGYRPPTEKDDWWVIRHAGGETWRLQYRGANLGFTYEIWWVYEWRKRTRPPKWVLALGWSIEYGKRRRWGDDGEEITEPPFLPPADAEQLTLF